MPRQQSRPHPTQPERRPSPVPVGTRPGRASANSGSLQHGCQLCSLLPEGRSGHHAMTAELSVRSVNPIAILNTPQQRQQRLPLLDRHVRRTRMRLDADADQPLLPRNVLLGAPKLRYLPVAIGVDDEMMPLSARGRPSVRHAVLNQHTAPVGPIGRRLRTQHIRPAPIACRVGIEVSRVWLDPHQTRSAKRHGRYEAPQYFRHPGLLHRLRVPGRAPRDTYAMTM